MNRYKIINVIATLNSIKKIGVSPVVEMLLNICIRKLGLEVKQEKEYNEKHHTLDITEEQSP
jgi:hypothetical protein|tara:strand:+ start:163 stop:348 length:186 start_codon:yes stop_codon:yes gene_type:complete